MVSHTILPPAITKRHVHLWLFFCFLHSQKGNHREGEERERDDRVYPASPPQDPLKLRALFALEATKKASDQI